MPLEVTPVPVADQQLPYTPKFTPVDIQGLPGPGSAPGFPGSIARGPASAAESALIPPAPGGVAGPHHAIPALPDAGYTAPTLHAASVAGGSPAFVGGRMPPNAGGYGDSASLFGNSAFGAGSICGGASVYENVGQGHHHHHHGGPMSTIYSEEWAPTSLPAPRRAPMPSGPTIAPLAPSESAIAPRGRHSHHHESDHHHHHHHHRHDDQEHEERRGRHEVDDDVKSDASYYARPKMLRQRSGSASPASDASSPRQPHRRAPSMSHQHSPREHMRDRSPQLQPLQATHSPVSPSPLGRPIPLPKDDLKGSPRSTTRGRRRAGSDVEEPRYRDAQKDKDAEREETRGDWRGRRGSKIAPRNASLSDSESIPHGRSHSRHGRHHSRHRSEAVRTEYRDENGEDDENGPYKRLNRLSLQEEAPHHRHHRSHSHVPPPVRAPSPGLEASFQPPAPASVYAGSLLAPSASYERPRRRTQSLHGMDQPHNLVNPYQAPSVNALGPVDAYDDGGSIAGSAMTFMDGSVGGRVSQYGLPKYAHQPKMDYRRYCVQRGNADVFLD